jgi:hypothetical protein
LRIRKEVTLPVYERLGDTRSAAITWGKIADIAERRGDYDEALRIHRDVELPVLERLGDTHSAAITWGQIADIIHRRGDGDEALRIHRDVELPVYQRLGDTDQIASTLWKIAQLHLDRQDYTASTPVLLEAYTILRGLQRTDGIAVVGFVVGQLLLAADELERGREILREAQEAAARLGDASIAELINQVLDQETDEEDEPGDGQ